MIVERSHANRPHIPLQGYAAFAKAGSLKGVKIGVIAKRERGETVAADAVADAVVGLLADQPADA